MEVVIDTKELDKSCACKSGKTAGNCCRKDEKCYCGSGKSVCECCMKEAKKSAAK